jgi:putative transposase
MLMHTAKNLYNEALYNVRQYYFETKSYLDYSKNYKLFCRNSDNYRILNAQQAQAVIRKGSPEAYWTFV